MSNKAGLVVALILIITGLIGIFLLPYFLSSFAGSPFRTLGEQIYFTGRGIGGRAIPFSYGPVWLRMRGGGCVSCHGTDGKGGFLIMMSNQEAPDITWNNLTSEKQEEGEEHPPYNEKTIKKAITSGLEPDGKNLDYLMPRWQMNEQELQEVINYLKKL